MVRVRSGLGSALFTVHSVQSVLTKSSVKPEYNGKCSMTRQLFNCVEYRCVHWQMFKQSQLKPGVGWCSGSIGKSNNQVYGRGHIVRSSVQG